MSTERDRLLSKSKAELVAQLREAEQELAFLRGEASTSSDVFQRVIDALPLMVYAKDREGRFLLANRVAHDAYGVPYGSLVGRFQREMHLAPTAMRRYGAADQRVIEDGERVDSPSSPFTRADGDRRIIDFIKVPWQPDTASATAVLVIGQDVTDRVDAENALLKQERFATLGQLTATVSHELRNPLGAMQASLYVLTARVSTDDSAVKRALERIDRNITRCDQIIDQLLDFTRLRTLSLEDVELSAWLHEVLTEQPRPQGLTLTQHSYSQPLHVTMDLERMRRAVVNVFENACQALLDPDRPGHARDGATLTVFTSRQDDRFEIWFEDNGPGIAPEDLPRVFEPLFTTKGFGTGLGLPAVRQILEQHGGGALLRSVPGAGARVLLWVPDARSVREMVATGGIEPPTSRL